MTEEWKEKVRGWLENEDLNNDWSVDAEWKVSEEEGVLVGKSYITPFVLTVDFVEDEHSEYMELTIHSGLGTSQLAPHEKEYLYKKMLKIHSDNELMKYSLDDTIQAEPLIKTDLDLAFLSKEEFEDALEFSLRGANQFFSSVVTKNKLKKIIGEDVSWEYYVAANVLNSILREIEEGDIDKELGARRLMSKFNFEHDEAKKMIEDNLDEEENKEKDLQEVAKEVKNRGPKDILY